MPGHRVLGRVDVDGAPKMPSERSGRGTETRCTVPSLGLGALSGPGCGYAGGTETHSQRSEHSTTLNVAILGLRFPHV